MIQLPPLTISRDEQQEVRLFLDLRRWLAETDKGRARGLHASELLDPLMSYWKWKDPKEITERQVYFFTIGKILHMLILSASTGQALEKSDEGTKHELGIYYSPDHSADGHPIELKTHRGNYEPKPERIQEEFHHYLEQLSIYMVLENHLVGELWVLFINLKDESNRTFPEPRCYRVSMTEEQFYAIEQEVLHTRDVLIRAKETDIPTELPLCRVWLCGSACPYFLHACMPPGRYPSTDKRRWTA